MGIVLLLNTGILLDISVVCHFKRTVALALEQLPFAVFIDRYVAGGVGRAVETPGVCNVGKISVGPGSGSVHDESAEGLDGHAVGAAADLVGLAVIFVEEIDVGVFRNVLRVACGYYIIALVQGEVQAAVNCLDLERIAYVAVGSGPYAEVFVVAAVIRSRRVVSCVLYDCRRSVVIVAAAVVAACGKAKAHKQRHDKR